MITQFKDYTDNSQPSQDKEEEDQIIIDNKGVYPRRMIMFENYWDDSVFNRYDSHSCRPFLENIGLLIGEEVKVGHRYIQSKNDLKYYLNDPGGVIWDHPETISVAYFALHGSKMGFPLTQGLVSKKEILQLCKGFGKFPNILFFSSCSLFEDDDQFGFDLLETGTLGVLGYKTDVPFAMSCLIDLFFLSSLFLFKDGDPFKNLQKIYDNTISQFPISKTLGFSLYC